MKLRILNALRFQCTSNSHYIMIRTQFLKKYFKQFSFSLMAYSCSICQAGTVEDFVAAWNDSTSDSFTLSEDYDADDGTLAPLTKTFTLTGELDEDGNKPSVAARTWYSGSDYHITLMVGSGGYLTISNVVLSNDIANSGVNNGGIYVSSGGVLNKVTNVDFIDCCADAGVLASGILNQGIIGYITDCSFINCMQTTCGSGANYGNISAGAILNYYTASGNAIIYAIKNCTFEGNVSGDLNGKGGAISNSYVIGWGQTGIYNSTFTNNIALDVDTPASSTGSAGGAIYDYQGLMGYSGTYGIDLCTFTGNISYSGGAIYSYGAVAGTNVKINDSTFDSNVAWGYGGAIYNNATMTISDSSFTNNTVVVGESDTTGQGGAIYNAGTLTILANTKDSLFSGNTAESISGVRQGESIYNPSSCVVNLKALDTYSITFDDQIYNAGQLNMGATDYDGTIAINDSVEGGGAINMYSGTLWLGSASSGEQVTYGNFLDGAAFTVSGGDALSTKDALTHSALLGNMALNETLDLYLDVDLASASGDVLMGSSEATGSGTLNLTDINLLSAGEESEIWVQIADTNIMDTIVLTDGSYSMTLDGASYEDYSVAYTTNETGGYLVFTQLLEKNLKYWVNLEDDLKIYTLAENELCNESIGALLDDASLSNGDGLVVTGDGYQIVASGDTITGITIDDSERYLILNDVSGVSGFTGNFIDSTTGVITINAQSNDAVWDNGISSDHELYFNADANKTIIFNADITGSGTVTINAADDATGQLVMNASLSNEQIIVSKGELVMNAADGESVQLQGQVSGDGGLVVNDSVTGTVVLDGALSTASVDLLAGTLSLTQTSSITGTDWTSLDGTTLDLANGSTGNVLTLGSMSIDGTTHLSLDIDLWNVTADTITTDSLTLTNDGQLLITEINIVADSKQIPLTTVHIADEDLMATISLSSTLTVSCSNGADETYGNYFISYDNTSGDLSFSYADINTAFSSEVPEKFYVMLSDNEATADLGLMGGKNDAALLVPAQDAILTISGNGHSVSGANFAGATIAEDTRLIINDVASWSGFDGDVFTNNGTITINSINNELSTIDGSISGTGNLELNESEEAVGMVQLGDVSGQETTLHRGSALLAGTYNNGIVNLDAGVLYLASTASTTDSVALNANGGDLDVYDSVLNDYSFESITGVDSTTQTASNFVIDVDVVNQVADTFTAGSFSGDLLLYINPFDNLEQMSESNLSGEIEIFKLAEGSTDSLEDFNFFPDSGNYVFYTPTANLIFVQHDDPDKLGWIKFELETGKENSLALTVQDVEGYRFYSMAYDETAGGGDMNDYGDMKILGNGHSIIEGGFTVIEGKSMTVVNANFDELSTIAMEGSAASNAQLTMDNDGASVVLGSAIEGTGADANSVTLQGSGSFTLDNEVSGVQLTMKDATIIVNNDSNLGGATASSGDNVLHFEGATVVLSNNVASDIYLSGMSLSEGTNTQMSLDVDLSSISMDRFFSASDITASGSLEITSLNLLTDSLLDVTRINFTSDTALMAAIIFEDLTGVAGVSSVYNYVYDISYDATTGDFIFVRTSRSFNTDVFAGSVAMQAASMALLTYHEQAFNNYDQFTSKNQEERAAIEEQHKSYRVWLTPASAYGNAVLDNDLKIEEFSWGTYLGVDSSIKDVGKGWRSIYTVYAGYAGAEQKYDKVSITQNSGLGGLSALLYKKNFWTSLSANAGVNAADISTSSGKDHESMFMTGIASKTGYNVEMQQGDYILQPNVQVAYTYVQGFDYVSAAGVKMDMNSLNVLQVMPGIRLINNKKENWQPYASAQMVWNFGSGNTCTADGEKLPDMGIKPYVQYGVGSQYKMNERTTIYGQVMGRSGGRQGVSLNLGFSSTF